MKKRVLSLLMALVLCLSLLPTAVLADEGESGGTESGGIAPCDHGGASGFDANDMTCRECGAPAVASTALVLDDLNENPWRNFADLQTALDADRQGNAAFRLLEDVTGEYTINGSQITALTLNGHSINGTVTITGGTYETSFTRTKDTDIVQKVIAHAGAKLATPAKPAVIGTLELAEGATWENIVSSPRNPGYKMYTNYPDLSTYNWYAPEEVPDTLTALNNVSIERLPITSKNLSFKVNGKDVSSVDRGTTVQLCAYCNTSGADVAIYVKAPDSDGYAKYPSEYKKIGTSWYYVVDLDANTIGKYSIYFTASKDGYSVTSGDKKLTVNKATIPTDAITAPTAKTLTYNGQPQELVDPGSVDAQYGTMVYSLSRGASSFSTTIPTKTDAGTYDVYYKVIGEEGYKDTSPKYVTVTIAPMQIRDVNYVALSRPYTGSAEFTLADTEKTLLQFCDATMTRINLKLTDFEVSEGRFLAVKDGEYVASPEAGRKDAIELSVTLKNSNYVLQGPNDAQPASSKKYTMNTSRDYYINQATIDLSGIEFTQIVYNNLAKTYAIDLEPMLDALLARQTPAGVEYGTITYGTCSVNPTVDGYYDNNNPAAVANGVLTLPIAAATGANVGDQIATVTVDVTTTNYRQFDLTIKVVIGEKITLDQSGVSVSASDITYGQTLAESTLTATGSMICPRMHTEIPGTFAWTNGTIKPNAGDYQAEWTFTPAAGYEEYAPTTGKVTVKVNPKSIERAILTLDKNELIYTGQNIRPELVSVVLDGVTLTEGAQEDYVCMYWYGPAVGSHSVRVKGCNNYTGEAEATWEITPREVTPTIEVASCSYTGDVLEPTVTLTDDLGNIIDPKEYKAAYSNNINAGTGTVTVTDNHPNGNYVIKETSTTFQIQKAAAPTDIKTGTLNVINGTTQTYTYDFSKLLPELSKGEYGTVSYEYADVSDLKESYEVNGTVSVDGETGALSLPFKTSKYVDDQITGKVGTVKATVKTTNYEDFELTLTLNAINQITPTPDGNITATEITYGDALSKSEISGKMKDPVTGETVNGSFAWEDSTVQPDAGSYSAEWTFTPDESYGGIYATAAGKVYVHVKQVTIPEGMVVVKQKGTLFYTGSEQVAEVEITGAEELGTMTLEYAVGENYGHNPTVPAFTNAGTYRVHYIVRSQNYAIPSGWFTVTIEPKTLYDARIDAISKSYDGDASVTIPKSAVKFYDGIAPDGIVLSDDDFEITNARFTMRQEDGKSYPDSPEVGNGKSLSFHLKLKSSNYVLYKNETGEADYDTTTSDPDAYRITKANAPALEPIELTVYNGVAKTYLVELPALPALDENCTYGSSIKYEACDFALVGEGGYANSTATITSDNEFQLTVPAVPSQTEGSVGTVGVRITTDNYQDMLLTVKVIAKNKIVPEPDGEITASEIIYGDELSKSTISGAMKDGGKTVEGTFEWTDPDAKPENAGSYDAEWRFTPAAGYEEYASTTGTVTVNVARKDIKDAKVTLKADSFVYDGNNKTPEVASVILDGATLVYGQYNDYGYHYDLASDAGTYELIVTGNHNYTGKVTVNWHITQKTVTPTIEVADGSYVYNEGKEIRPAVTVKDGETEIPDSEYTVSYTDNTNAGTATVTVTDKEGGNYALGTVSVTFTIGKADASVKTAPAARTLTYNGNEQQLVTAGEALGGTMVYSLDGETYGRDIPTAANAGEYTVYYKVEGDSNHNSTAAVSVTVTIARAKLTGEVACRTFPCYGYTLGDTHITAPEGWPEGGFQWYDVNGKALANDTMIIPDATYQWVFRDDLGNYEPVSGSIVLWNYVPETTETGKSETVKNPDGSTTTTVTKPDGTVTETTTTPDGTTSTTTTDKDGNTDTDVRVSDKAVSDAKKDGSTIKLPVDGRPGQEIDIDIRTGGEDVTIEIPVSGATGGTVAIIVKDDGTEEVVRESVVTGDGIRMKVSGSVTVKVADRSKDFIDMRGHWAKDEVDTVVARGLFNGTSDTMFSPSLPMTRGMVVTVLARMSGVDTSGGAKWYDKGCAWAVANGISDGTAPEASITREQLVTMLYRYAKLRGVDVTASGTALQSFSDYESVSPYAVEAMDWAVTKGLVNGINGQLEPQGTATRAQVAAIFARFLKLL